MAVLRWEDCLGRSTARLSEQSENCFLTLVLTRARAVKAGIGSRTASGDAKRPRSPHKLVVRGNARIDNQGNGDVTPTGIRFGTMLYPGD